MLLFVAVVSNWLPGPRLESDGVTIEAQSQPLIAIEPSGSPDTRQTAGTPDDGRSEAEPTDDAEEIDRTGTLEPDERADAIAAELAAAEGLFGVVMIDERGSTVFRQNADVPFLSASLYKIVLMADILAGIEDGALDPVTEVTLFADYFPAEGDFEDSYFPESWIDQSVAVGDLLFATGAYSSNVAANALRSLTSTSELDAMAGSLGMTGTLFFADPSTNLAWPPDQPNGVSDEDFALAVSIVEEAGESDLVSVTTPGDVATFFERLLAGMVHSEDVSNSIVTILSQQVIVDRIPYLLPADTDVTHKTGNLDHVVHDAGIIWTPDGPVILVVMIEDAPDDLIAIEIIQRIALIAYGGVDPEAVDPATL